MDQGHVLVFATCRPIQAILAAQAYLTLGKPRRQPYLAFTSILEVFDYPGVASVLITYAAFGEVYLEPTSLLHFFPNSAVLARPLHPPTPTLIELRGWVMPKGERVPARYGPTVPT